MPASHRFDLKARAAVKRGLQTTYAFCHKSLSRSYDVLNVAIKNRNLCLAFGCAYPVLGAIFFQSGILIQALLIPVFFIIRAGFEYGADAITSHTFGSDGMPAINFGGVMMHEICLSVMITSIKYPLVFVSLVMSDVLENSFCLWSLARNVRRSSNRVSPGDNTYLDGKFLSFGTYFEEMPIFDLESIQVLVFYLDTQGSTDHPSVSTQKTLCFLYEDGAPLYQNIRLCKNILDAANQKKIWMAYPHISRTLAPKLCIRSSSFLDPSSNDGESYIPHI